MASARRLHLGDQPAPHTGTYDRKRAVRNPGRAHAVLSDLVTASYPVEQFNLESMAASVIFDGNTEPRWFSGHFPGINIYP